MMDESSDARVETIISISLPVDRDSDLLDKIATFAMNAANEQGVDAIITSESRDV